MHRQLLTTIKVILDAPIADTAKLDILRKLSTEQLAADPCIDGTILTEIPETQAGTGPSPVPVSFEDALIRTGSRCITYNDILEFYSDDQPCDFLKITELNVSGMTFDEHSAENSIVFNFLASNPLYRLSTIYAHGVHGMTYLVKHLAQHHHFYSLETINAEDSDLSRDDVQLLFDNISSYSQIIRDTEVISEIYHCNVCLVTVNSQSQIRFGLRPRAGTGAGKVHNIFFDGTQGPIAFYRNGHPSEKVPVMMLIVGRTFPLN